MPIETVNTEVLNLQKQRRVLRMAIAEAIGALRNPRHSRDDIATLLKEALENGKEASD